MATDQLKRVASTKVDDHRSELFHISKELWENPELNFEEHKAHRLLSNYLELKGFAVQRGYGGLATAFRASFGTGRPNVCVICEYDALPGIGHACGHNLIAEAGVAAGMGVKAAIVEGKLTGRVTVLGTPAEEGGGGKVFLIESGAFADIDIAIMSHPSPKTIIRPPYLAVINLEVTYTGKAAHAAAFPWEGVNALDAAVMAYSSISAARQQFKPSWRVHGVITNGGVKPNIIPEKATMSYFIRTPEKEELAILRSKVVACFQGAARATGCQVEVVDTGMSYENVRINPVLADLYEANIRSLGITDISGPITGGSTDMGNVSHMLPAIHPKFAIGSGKEVNHSVAFTEVANSPESNTAALTAGKALAFTCIDVLTNAGTLENIKAAFNCS